MNKRRKMDHGIKFLHTDYVILLSLVNWRFCQSLIYTEDVDLGL